MPNVTFNASALASLRDAVGTCLADLGERYPRMVVLTADVDISSRVGGFIERFPDRHFNMGIAEQNLMSFAAGLAHEGYTPFVFSFAPFATMRGCEQIRTDICYPNLPVRIIGNGAGYSNGESGPTHCALEDVAITSSFGNMTVIEPGDPFLTAKVLEATMEHDGPVYIRMGREARAALYPQETPYRIGKALVPRAGDDGAFIAAGIVVHHALEAAQRLEDEKGKHVRVVDMHTVKPLDRDAVLDAARTGRVIAAQDHNLIGGMPQMVGALIAEAGVACRFQMLGCPNEFVPIATPDFLYRRNGYDAQGLYERMAAMFE